MDKQAARSPLHGIPVGVKGMIDTRDMPKPHNSNVYCEHRPLAGRRTAFGQIASECDAVLTPSAPGEAVAGQEPGDAVFNRMWTLLHVPRVTVPGFFGPNEAAGGHHPHGGGRHREMTMIDPPGRPTAEFSGVVRR